MWSINAVLALILNFCHLEGWAVCGLIYSACRKEGRFLAGVSYISLIMKKITGLYLNSNNKRFDIL